MKFANPSYKPKPNGCGTKGMTIIKNFNPQFTPCCNNHDRCYGTCGNSKEYCDNSFKNCMRNTCALFNVACRAAADSYYLAVHLFGCTAYTNVQKKACMCTYYI